MMLTPSTPANRAQAPQTSAWRSLKNDQAPLAQCELLRQLVESLGGDADAIHDASTAASITLWHVHRAATLLHEGAPAHVVYVLRSGSLKFIHTHKDGYEQVLSVALPGDLLGFEALHSGYQPAGVVALEDVTVYALPLDGLASLRRQCAALDQALQVTLSRQLVRAASTAEMIAAVASDVRLARFLLLMSTRMAEIGQSPSRLRLRLSRRDIASLLGMAHETVSRSFTTLADAGYLKVDNREVEILDLAGLRMRSLSTRRQIDDAVRRPVRQPVAASRAPALSMAWFPRSSAPSVATA